MSDFPRIAVSDSVPPGEVHFVVLRKYKIVVLPDGEKQKVWLESEEEWARKCGVIRGLKI